MANCVTLHFKQKNFCSNKSLVLLLYCLFCIFIKSGLSEYESSSYYNGIGMIYFFDNVKVLIQCKKKVMITKEFSAVKWKRRVTTVGIDNCLLPPTPIIETLTELNIVAKDMTTLVLNNLDPLEPGNYTKGLNIDTLEIISMKYNVFESLQKEFFSRLMSLKLIILDIICFPSLPLLKQPYSLFLRENSWIENWNNCQYLQKLLIHNLQYITISKNLSLSCPKLDTVEIISVTPEILQEILYGIRLSWENLVHLSLSEIKLFGPAVNDLAVMKNLNRLYLTENSLNDESISNFPTLKKLTFLSLEKNLIRGFFLPDLLKRLPALEILVLKNNVDLKCGLPPYLNTSLLSEHSSSLKLLSFAGTEAGISCFENTNFPNLVQLDLRDSRHQFSFRLKELPKTNSSKFVVLLQGQSHNIIFGYKEYTELSDTGDLSTVWGSNANLIIAMDKAIDCNCEHYWLSRARYDFPKVLRIAELLCNNTPHKSELFSSFQSMECYDFEADLPYNLTVEDWTLGVQLDIHESTVDIWNKISKLHYRVDVLNVSDNQNFTLNDCVIPDTLLELDLRNVSLRLSRKELEILFSVPERHVWLSGNIFICHCEYKPLLDILHQHQNQIMDFAQLKCLNDNSLLYSVSLEICSLQYPLSFGGMFIVFMIIATWLLWRYGLHIKVYLYSNGWCLSCLGEEDIDKDRLYDAFLAFAHGDDEYVLEELLPKLESEPYRYQICMHYRDWVVGDWILKQVSRSVRLSKRTIIVLSRSFVASQWGCLEFRYAVADSAANNRSRVIVLVLDDVLEQPLNEEFQKYLSMNTYMHCQDPWFWQRLSYAMPHKQPSVGHRAVTPEPPLEILLEVLPQ